VQHPIHCLIDYVIDNEEINAEENDRDNHHRRSGLDFFPARKRNFPHLIADVSEKAFYARRKLRHLVASIVVVARHRYRFRH
jgi:hypothetical protein